MLPKADKDFIDFRNIGVVIQEEISLISDKWHFEVLANEITEKVRGYVDDPTSYEGVFSRVLILMQWSNILNALTMGKRHDCYFNSSDFIKIIQAGSNDTHRLTVQSLNNHFKWIEIKYKERHTQSERDPELRLGRINEQKTLNVKEE